MPNGIEGIVQRDCQNAQNKLKDPLPIENYLLKKETGGINLAVKCLKL